MDSFFKPAGDIDEFRKNNNLNQSNNAMNEYFVPANKFVDVNTNISFEKIDEYLSKVVTNKEYPYECELGTLCGMCTMFVNFERLVNMVESGNFNIIKAKCYNPEMIEVSFQEYNKQCNKHF